MIPSGKTVVAGVLGWPVGCSLSPRVHGYWLDCYGIDGAYVPLEVRPDDFANALAALSAMGFAGANITVPHKGAAVTAVHACSDEARKTGSVNTVVVRPDGRLYGTTTDGFGFLENVRESIPGWAPGSTAVVIGAGGGGRAIAWALADAGASDVRVVNRTADRARQLAAAIGPAAQAVPWEQSAAALEGAALLVNTTTLGMTGQPPLDLALDALPPNAVVTDIVYAPLETPLLAAARRRGNPAVDGLGMLLHQARPGFTEWFGREPEVTPELRAFVLQGS